MESDYQEFRDFLSYPLDLSVEATFVIQIANDLCPNLFYKVTFALIWFMPTIRLITSKTHDSSKKKKPLNHAF